MRHLWIIVLVGCTSSSTPGTQQNLPDHFDENLDVIVRSVTHPCGADADNDGDGVVEAHWRYTYDSQGRSMEDIEIDNTGMLLDQTDYAWDNAGNLVDQKDKTPGFGGQDVMSVYDSLGRRTQYVFTDFDDNMVLTRRTTYNYSQFDELGHSTHADELIEGPMGKMQTMTRTYGYDDLGRRILLDVHKSTGEAVQTWHYSYDDAARTETTHFEDFAVNQGTTTAVNDAVWTFDADYHFIADHETTTYSDNSPSFTTDMTEVWQGDREISNTTTTVGGGMTFGNSITYKYSCN